ncbi:MAG: PDZ domain-containing protein [Ignavibacteriales bacterium]|nr:PDZ domain-containing protein [Ignavibacteriales bacterium]
MRIALHFFSVLVLIGSVFSIVPAQEQMQQLRFDRSNSALIPEIGTVFTKPDKDGPIKVGFKLPNEGQVVADFKMSDVVLSINNKAVNTLKELEKQYAGMKVGSTIIFEVEREGKKTTVAFKKPQPSPNDGKPMIIHRNSQ